MRNAAVDVAPAAYDPYKDSVTLHIQDGSITDLVGHTITNSGVTSNTSIKKYGSSSMYFNGSSYMTVSASNDTTITASDFTVEGWIYLTSNPANLACILGTSTWVVYFTSGALAYTTQSVATVSSSTVLALNTWYHVAVVRQSTTVTIFLNGSVIATGTVGSTTPTATDLIIGNQPGQSRYLTGAYLQDLRITKGVARYTQPFAAPTGFQLTNDYAWVSGDKYDPFWAQTTLS